jgi:PIN domain nuclease of toxin-antitoxin system
MNSPKVDFLFDTHTLIWAATDPQRLSRKAAALIRAEQNVIGVSAASAWEIATKVRLGKLPEAYMLEQDFPDEVRGAGYVLLSISTEVALRSGRLLGRHKDPFDRMIVAQALELDIPIISLDSQLDGFGVRRIW